MEGKINGREAKKNGEGKNNLSLSLLPALPIWPCLWFPAGACFHPAIPPLSRSSPEMKQKLVKVPQKKVHFQHDRRIMSLRPNHPVHAFLEKMLSFTCDIYPWMNELTGEVLKEANSLWVMTLICRLIGHMDTRVHFLLNVFPPGFIERSLTSREVEWRTLMVVSPAKWCPFLGVGAEAACKSQLYSVLLSPLGKITQAFSAALSLWVSSMSAYSHFANYITAFNPPFWTC